MLAQAALRVPPEVALQCIAGHSYQQLSFLAQAACVHHAQLGHCYYHRSVFLSSFFFSLCILLLTHFGESPVCENLFPTILWHNQKIYAKKYICLGNFYFFTKKKLFSSDFSTFYGQHSVTAAWATRSPWSICMSFLVSGYVYVFSSDLLTMLKWYKDQY